MSKILCVVQVLVALLYLFAVTMNLIMPIAEMTRQMAMPGWFLRGLGVAEILGACGLILPGLLHIKTFLTPLAAVCLVVIMIGATVITLMIAPPPMAAIPFFVGVFAAFVAYG